MHAISSYRGNRPTNTNTQTHRQDPLQYTAPQPARSVISLTYISWPSVRSTVHEMFDTLGPGDAAMSHTSSAAQASTRARPGFFIGGRLKGRRPRSRGWGSWGGGQQTPPHQLGGLGSTVSSPGRVRGGTPTAQRFSTIFSIHDGLC